MRHFSKLIILILYLLSLGAAADGPSPLRLGVDIFNSVGSTSRLIAFMKIGASASDQRYLAFLNAKLSGEPLPRALMAGNMVYIRGLDEPLKVVDLRSRRFSFNGQSVDLNLPGGIERAMHLLNQSLTARKSFTFISWLLPEAVASGNSSAAHLAAVLAVGGLASTEQCLAIKNSNCSPNAFMGALGAMGAVGAFKGPLPPQQAFCTPDPRGGQTFAIYSQKAHLVSLSQNGIGEDGDSALTQKATATLLSTCANSSALAAVNTAFAYPSTLASTPMAMPTRRFSTTVAAPQVQPTPSVASEPVRDTSSESGGAAR